MRKQLDDTKPTPQRTSLAALMSILLFAAAADGLMEALGPDVFLLAGALVMGLAWAMGTQKKDRPEAGKE